MFWIFVPYYLVHVCFSETKQFQNDTGLYHSKTEYANEINCIPYKHQLNYCLNAFSIIQMNGNYKTVLQYTATKSISWNGVETSWKYVKVINAIEIIKFISPFSLQQFM